MSTEFIEDKNIPKLDNFYDAIGIFQFEWDQLVVNSEDFKNNFTEINSTFQHIIFKDHLEFLNDCIDLSKVNFNDLIQDLPDWKSVYENIIPFEDRETDLKNLVISCARARVCDKYCVS